MREKGGRQVTDATRHRGSDDVSRLAPNICTAQRAPGLFWKLRAGQIQLILSGGFKTLRYLPFALRRVVGNRARVS